MNEAPGWDFVYNFLIPELFLTQFCSRWHVCLFESSGGIWKYSCFIGISWKNPSLVDDCSISASYFKKSRNRPTFKLFPCLRHTWYKPIQPEEIDASFVWHCCFLLHLETLRKTVTFFYSLSMKLVEKMAAEKNQRGDIVVKGAPIVVWRWRILLFC